MKRMPSYNPTSPTYAPDDWVTTPKCTRTVGTQTVALKKKRKSPQHKLTALYTKAIDKHWVQGKDKRKLRRILKDIFSDKKIAWGHVKATGLIMRLKRMKKTDDKQIKKWSKGVMKLWRKKFNMRKLK